MEEERVRDAFKKLEGEACVERGKEAGGRACCGERENSDRYGKIVRTRDFAVESEPNRLSVGSDLFLAA